MFVCLKPFPQITPQPSPSSLLATQLEVTLLSGHKDRDLYKPVPPLPPHRMLSRTLHCGDTSRSFTVGTRPGAQTTICRTCRLGPWCCQSLGLRAAGSETTAPFFHLPFSLQGMYPGQVGLIFSLWFRFGTCPFSFVRICVY